MCQYLENILLKFSVNREFRKPMENNKLGNWPRSGTNNSTYEIGHYIETGIKIFVRNKLTILHCDVLKNEIYINYLKITNIESSE